MCPSLGGVLDGDAGTEPASADASSTTSSSTTPIAASLTQAKIEDRAAVVSRSDSRDRTDQAKEAALSQESGPGVTRSEDLSEADPREIAQALLPEYGFSADQFSCLDSLYVSESDWRHHADNPTSSAYGIPQALTEIHDMPPGYLTSAEVADPLGPGLHRRLLRLALRRLGVQAGQQLVLSHLVADQRGGLVAAPVDIVRARRPTSGRDPHLKNDTSRVPPLSPPTRRTPHASPCPATDQRPRRHRRSVSLTTISLVALSTTATADQPRGYGPSDPFDDSIMPDDGPQESVRHQAKISRTRYGYRLIAAEQNSHLRVKRGQRTAALP